LGPINLDGERHGLDGRVFYEPLKISEKMAGKVDAEITRLIDEGLAIARGILKKYRRLLDKIATELLAKETLDGEEFEKIVGGKVAIDK
jgi:cell division protease FtsH